MNLPSPSASQTPIAFPAAPSCSLTRGFSRAEPAQCAQGGEGTLRLVPPGLGDLDTCRVGTLPGPDTVINALMAAKPLCKHALISDTGRSAGTCERAGGLGVAAPQSSADPASD